jgi:hypothetical protein
MRYLWFIILAVLFLSACDGDNAEDTPNTATSVQATPARSGTDLPPTWTPSPEGFIATAAPTRTPHVQQIVTREATDVLPPTWTPLPRGFVPSPIPTDASGSGGQSFAPREGVTPLPPTWTPAPTSTPRTPERTVPPLPTIFVFSGTLEDVDDICYLFQPDPGENAGSQFVRQNSPTTVFWNAIPLPGYTYRFRLYHPDGTMILDEQTSDTQFIIPENFLVAENQVYEWEVQPLKDGQLTCFIVTDEIFVQSLEN